MKATMLRPGLGVKIDGKLSVLTQVDHRTPGNLRAFIQIKYKDILAGKTLEKRLASSDDVEVIDLDRRPMEFLFKDINGATFMDLETFDQIVMPKAIIEENILYFRPNTECVVLCNDGQPITLEMPATVDLTVTETSPGIKGATATNQMKDATLETGLKTRVPPFITVGETVTISTSDASYMSRA
jgi:elongation factor P